MFGHVSGCFITQSSRHPKLTITSLKQEKVFSLANWVGWIVKGGGWFMFPNTLTVTARAPWLMPSKYLWEGQVVEGSRDTESRSITPFHKGLLMQQVQVRHQRCHSVCSHALCHHVLDHSNYQQLPATYQCSLLDGRKYWGLLQCLIFIMTAPVPGM